MANQIRMTPETMRTRASEYTTEAGNIQQVINKLDRLLTQLQSEWEGDASRAYAEKFNQLRPGFVKTKDLVDEISAALRKTAQIVEDTDRNIAGQFRG
ncbi:MAG: WXG100 family type VII secretion target [Eubacterium sp.]